MLCISISHVEFEECKEALRDLELAEIRLDTLHFSTRQVQELFSSPQKLIATFRPGKISEDERKDFLLAAIESGAAYVDIEIEAGDSFRESVIERARQKGCYIIISYHNHKITPSRNELLEIIDRCFECGADIAKIACLTLSEADSARILSLYDCSESRAGKVLALGMGEKGKITRIAAPLLGAPFTFAAPTPGHETAPGQLDRKTIEKIIGLVQR